MTRAVPLVIAAAAAAALAGVLLRRPDPEPRAPSASKAGPSSSAAPAVLAPSIPVVMSEPPAPAQPSSPVALRATVTSPVLPPAQRISALRGLRSHAPSELTPDVVACALELAQRPEWRAEVCRGLAGSSAPEVEAALLTWMKDPDAGVRKEAVEALASRKADPRVRSALEEAARDPDPHVRKRAERVLRPSR